MLSTIAGQLQDEEDDFVQGELEEADEEESASLHKGRNAFRGWARTSPEPASPHAHASTPLGLGAAAMVPYDSTPVLSNAASSAARLPTS